MNSFLIVGKPGPAGPGPVITWDGSVIEVNGVPGPDLEGPASTVPGPPGITTRYLTLGAGPSDVAITTGAKDYRLEIQENLTIQGFRFMAKEATTATVRVYKDGVSPVEITGSTTRPSLVASRSSASTTLTGWDTALTAGDVLYLTVDSNDLAKFLSLTLEAE